MIDYDPFLYQKALETEGFFNEEEAQLLMRAISQVSSKAKMLEIGSYYGRSTLFALAALNSEQRWVVVDSFRSAAAYSGHSFWKLHNHVADSRIIILPMTLARAYRHLYGESFDLVFIDGDHSFLGVTQDIALSIALAAPGATLLCHDVCELFPGVVAAVEALQRANVLKQEECVGTLVRFRICDRPRWLIDPAVFRGDQL